MTLWVATGTVIATLTACSGGDGAESPDRAAVALPTPSPSGDAQPGGTTGDAVPEFHRIEVFYLGDSPRGPMLFRHSILVMPGVGRLETAVNGLLEQPDLSRHHTSWEPGWLTGAATSGGHVTVDADGAPSGRPPGMDERTAFESVQQVVYTLQAASGTHDPVQFTRNGRPASSVLGVPTRNPVRAAPLAQTVSLMSIDDGRLDGTFVSRGPIPVTGLSNTAHGAIDVRIVQNGRTVRSWHGHSSGSGAVDRLYPWRIVMNTKGLQSGYYLVVASGPDPTDPALTVRDERRLLLGGRN